MKHHLKSCHGQGVAVALDLTNHLYKKKEADYSTVTMEGAHKTDRGNVKSFDDAHFILPMFFNTLCHQVFIKKFH
jgi:hypothetical protein